MNPFKTVWAWLSITKNQKTLTFIGGGLVIVATAGWQAYLHFSKSTGPNPTISVSGSGIANTGSMTAGEGGTATNIVGNNNTVGDVNASANIIEIVNTLTQKHQLDSHAKDEQIKALTEAVTALSKGEGILGSKAQTETALAILAKGDTAEAKALFAKAAQQGEQDSQKIDRQTAENYRYLGALAYLDNTQDALAAYRRATELDPDNAESWNYLGLLLMRVGDLDGAIAAYSKVLALGEAHSDNQEIAMAYGNLGIVYQTRGDLGKAVVYYLKSLALNEGLGSKKGMVSDYSLLGHVYVQQGRKELAKQAYQKSIDLFKAIGNPTMVKKSQGWLDAL